MRTIILVGLGIVAIAAAGGYLIWRHWQPNPPCDRALYNRADRDALIVAEGGFDDPVEKVIYLDQGWTPGESMDFYTRTQGSRLLPYTWFLALEQADSDKPFRSAANMNRYGYLPQSANACNPDGLPVGFVKDPKRDGGKEDWLGLNCAACHTNQIHFGKTAFRIDGAPTMGDLDLLQSDMTRALRATVEDPAKFDRFAKAVIRMGSAGGDRERLKQELIQVSSFRAEYDNRNRSPHAYGFARLDAFGRIMNEILVRDLGVTAEGQGLPPNAPVSYPFLWDTPHHDVVQWNGVARNDIVAGPLTRNVGEVMGVFGEVEIPEQGQGGIGFNSSIRIPDLVELESLVGKLHSPLWPAELPPIDPKKRDLGKQLFARYCVECHPPINRTDPKRSIKAHLSKLSDVGTDRLMAENFAFRRAKTGKLKGRIVGINLFDRFQDEANGDAILIHTVAHVILKVNNEYKESDLLNTRRVPPFKETDAANLLVYKGRPLNGIWATAPYLHNGSVPNLYELLLPASERSSQFFVGSRELDPVKVGFKTEGYNGFLYRVRDGKVPIPGNSNAGHEYGTGKPKSEGGDGLPRLTEDDRWNLVEYMKSL